MQKHIRLFSLPGFLGKVTDWQNLLKAKQDIQHIACDYYAKEFAHPSEGLWKWAESFTESIVKQFGLPSEHRSNILIGYSLGGRLGMHALLQAPSLWNAAVFVSAHPGLDEQEGRFQRQQQDRHWANRFLFEPWEEVVSAWNHQPIFQYDQKIDSRQEEDYDRSLLADTLRFWSVAQQDSLKAELAHLQCPILWIAGEYDRKYAELAQQMCFKHPLAKAWIVPQVGHRVPWAASQLFFEQLNLFISKL